MFILLLNAGKKMKEERKRMKKGRKGMKGWMYGLSETHIYTR
jgi:hypothetical protein